MSWSKGAVVIVKHGDQEWADAIEKSMNIQKASIKEVEEMQKSNKYCFFPKRHTVDELKQMIDDAERQYGRKWWWNRPKWVKPIAEGFAFIVYHFSLFVNKYMTIKEDGTI